ncbi:protocadherin-19, partial [Aplysia californica]|uniref:Protocadherin-19 n=1 Tax=Aplysia californica TaxID=6500 RepID=A0ABM1AAW0_APLCA
MCTRKSFLPRHLMPLRTLLVLLLVSYTCADIEVEIDEELAPGSYVTDIPDHATVFNNLDPDQIPLMTYAILDQNSPPANYFRVESQSGRITVVRKMDREEVCDQTVLCEVQFNMAIQSSPEARVAFSNVVTVKVVIRDINDNTPTFPAGDVTLELSEGAKVGTELKISGAVDRDSRPEFTVQHYNSTPALPEFSIRPITNPDGSSSINLRLERELDREATPMYVFNIIAYDGGAEPRSDYLKVTIKVTDDNDNSPVFEPSQYELTINED